MHLCGSHACGFDKEWTQTNHKPDSQSPIAIAGNLAHLYALLAMRLQNYWRGLGVAECQG